MGPMESEGRALLESAQTGGGRLAGVLSVSLGVKDGSPFMSGRRWSCGGWSCVGQGASAWHVPGWDPISSPAGSYETEGAPPLMGTLPSSGLLSRHLPEGP